MLCVLSVVIIVCSWLISVGIMLVWCCSSWNDLLCWCVDECMCSVVVIFVLSCWVVLICLWCMSVDSSLSIVEVVILVIDVLNVNLSFFIGVISDVWIVLRLVVFLSVVFVFFSVMIILSSVLSILSNISRLMR